MDFKGQVTETEKGFFTIFPDLCKGCGLCIEKCPKNCLSWSESLGVYGTPTVKIDDRCITCGTCQSVCPDCAIIVVKIEKKVI